MDCEDVLPSSMSSTPRLSQAALDAGFVLSPNVTKVVKFGVRLRHVEFQGKGALIPTEHEIKHAAWLRKAAPASDTPNLLLCMSRIWGGGWCGQCATAIVAGSEYCKLHKDQLARQGYCGTA